MKSIDKLAIQTIRTISLEEINAANSGHPGIALGSSPIIYTLYSKVLKVNPFDPTWFNRDRFVLAAGHGSSMYYAILHLMGYPLTIDDLKNFRKLNSKTPGHPEIECVSGIDASSGPLGQGIPEAVGMAIAEKHLAHKFNKDNIDVVDHYTYVLCGDGDLQEGVTQEALSLAGHLNLSKLIILYDSNNIQLDGRVDLTNTENVREKYEAMNFDYQKVEDGEDIEDIFKAIKKAKKSNNPSIIEIKTIIGKGSSLENTNKVHGSPLDIGEVAKFREMLGGESFSINKAVYDLFDKRNQENKKVYEKEIKLLEKYCDKYPEKYNQLEKQLEDAYEKSILDIMPNYNLKDMVSTRQASGEILKALQIADDRLIGGSADLSSSTKVAGIYGNFSSKDPLGRNINFGVREHAMAAICNGITLHKGLKGFCGGFFVFSDYMKPAIRLAALMNLPTLFIFTHDSIGVGEDGPTHQPIEQLTMLRSIPNLNVIRPCDAIETCEAYDVYMKSNYNPTVLVLTRQNVEVIREKSEENKLSKGAYVIFPEEGELERIILASGSEVSLAISVAKELKGTRVISFASFYLFEKQTKEYQNEVLPRGVKRIAIEASEASHFYKYLSLDDELINISSFGKSGNANEVFDYFGFTKEKILSKISE